MAYRVTGAFVQVTASGPTGTQKVALYEGAMLPPDVPQEEIRHHLSVGMIEKVGDGEGPVGPGLVADRASGPGQESGADQGGDSQVEEDPERAKAREKLPADGSAPHANSGEAVWVEYAVTRGYDYQAAKAAGKAELVKLLTQQ